MANLWDDAEALLTSEIFAKLLETIGYDEKWEDGSIVKNLEKVLSMATPAIPYVPKDDIDMDIKFNCKQTEFKSLLSLVPAVYAKDFASVKTAGKLSLNGFAKGIYNDKKCELLPILP